jgi:hypothetical protein
MIQESRCTEAQLRAETLVVWSLTAGSEVSDIMRIFEYVVSNAHTICEEYLFTSYGVILEAATSIIQ